jgi:hypothetical protein
MKEHFFSMELLIAQLYIVLLEIVEEGPPYKLKHLT